MGHTKISTDIEQNIKQFQQLFADSADIKMKEMRLGKGKRRRCFLAYIEVAVSNMLLETTALGRLLAALSELPDRDLNQVLNENAMGDFRCDTVRYHRGCSTGDAHGGCHPFCGWIRTCIKDCRQRISRHGGAGTGFGKGDPWFEGGVYRFHQNEYGTYP